MLAEADGPATARGFHRLRVAAVARETEDAVSITFDVPPELAQRFRFRPGQYLTLRGTVAGEELRRSYSVCSGPEEPLRVAVKLVPDGRFSAWAHAELAAGHAVEVMAPAGRFVLPQAERPRHVLLVAAGSGITPILSVLKHALSDEPGTALTLLYGSRSTAQILFREELEALKDRFLTRLSVHHVLSREQQDIPVLNGRLDEGKLAGLVRGRPDLVMVCGPAGLIDAVTGWAAAAGLPPDRVLSERFTAEGTLPRPSARPAQAAPGEAPACTAPACTATVIADGVATAVPLRDGEAILDAALRAGLDLPYSCRAGMCSTCRARVTDGEVAMAVNFGLEPWETEAGFVLTCQAHPRTARVTVDYDHV